MKILAVLLVASMAAAGFAFAHGDKSHAPAAKKAVPADEKTFGREGDPKKVTRTITIAMSDKMRYTPDAMTIKPGDTVRFVVKNDGKIMHEMVIGTMRELKEHAALMKKHPGMEHEEPYMAHVAPGKSATLVWQFTKPGEFYFGCLIPGHFEAGMVGKITVKS